MKPVTAVSRTSERPSKRSDVRYFDSICTTRTQKTNRPPFGKGKCRRFRRAVHRRAAFFYGRGRSLAGAIRLWNGGGQVANMTRFTLIIRARRASPSLPVRSHIRQNCLPIHCQRDIREREREQSGSSIGGEGEGGTKQRSLFVPLSVLVRPSVRLSHRSPWPAAAITFLCCPLLIKHFYLVQVCTRRDAHCSRHLPLALLRRPSCE